MSKKWIPIVSALALLLTSVLMLPAFSGLAADTPVLEYTFDDGQQGFQYGTADGASGIWDCQIPGGDGSFGMQFWSDNGGWVNGPDGLNVDAASIGSVTVRIKNAGPNDVDKFYVYYTTTEDAAYNDAKRVEFTIKKASESADYAEYTANVSWTGTLKQIRMQTGTGARTVGQSNWIYIDYVRFNAGETADDGSEDEDDGETAVTPVAEFTFDDGTQGWQYGVAAGSGGIWDCQIPGTDGSFGMQYWAHDGGWVNGPDGMNLDAASIGSVTVRIKNAGPNDIDKFYLYYTTTEDTAFDDAKRVEFTIKKASESAEYAEYTANVSWTGTLKQLRMQTGKGQSTVNQSCWIYIDNIRLDPVVVTPTTAVEYTFDDGTQGWQYGVAAGSGGIWDCQIPGTDGSFGMQYWAHDGGWVNGPEMSVNAADVQTVTVRIKNAGPNDIDKFYLYFTTAADTTFNDAKRVEFTIKKASESTEYVEYTADVSTLDAWTGTIKQLRMQTGKGQSTVNQSCWIYIDNIKLSGVPSASGDEEEEEKGPVVALRYTFDDGTQGWQYGIAEGSGGIWDCRIPGTDGSFGMQYWAHDGGWVNSPDNLGLPTDAVASIKVRLKNAGPNDIDKFYLYYTTTEDTVFNAAKRIEFAIQKASENAEYVEYVVDPATLENWTGTIKQLRMQTGTGESTVSQSCWIYIDDILFEGLDTKDASLKSLAATGLAFDDGEFNTNKSAYTLTVPYETDKITLETVANSAGATVEGAGERALNVGENVLTVTVTSKDGTTQQTYTVTVTRRAQVMVDDATLREFTVTPNGIAFDPAVTDYTIEVVRGTKSVTVNAVPNSEHATVTGVGTVELTGNAQDIAVTVTAEDGTTQKTYTVHVKVSEVYGFTFDDNTIQNWNIGVEGAPIGASIASLTTENGVLRLEVDAHYGWMTNTGLNWNTEELKWLVIRVKNESDVGNLLRVWFATDENPDMYAGTDAAKTQRVEYDIMMAEEYDGYWEYGFDMTRLNTWKGVLTDLRFDFGRSGEGNPTGVLWVDSITFRDEFTAAEKPDPNANKNTTGSFDFEDNTTQSWTTAEDSTVELKAEDGKLVATFTDSGSLYTENLYLNLNAGDYPTLRLRLQNKLENADKLYVYFATSLFPDMDNAINGQFTQRMEATLVDTGDGYADILVDMSESIRWMGNLSALRIEVVGKEGTTLGGYLAFEEISLPQVKSEPDASEPDASEPDGSDETDNPDTGVAPLLFPVALLALSGAATVITRKKHN